MSKQKKVSQKAAAVRRTHQIDFAFHTHHPEGWSDEDLRKALHLVRTVSDIANKLVYVPGFESAFPPGPGRGAFLHPCMVLVSNALESLQRAIVCELLALNEPVPKQWQHHTPGYYSQPKATPAARSFAA